MVAGMESPGENGSERTLSRHLRDEGFEIIFACCPQSPEQVVSAAVQEAVDVLVMTGLSDSQLDPSIRVAGLLKEKGADDIILIVEGRVPEQESGAIYEAGIRKIFSGNHPEEVVDWIRRNMDTM